MSVYQMEDWVHVHKTVPTHLDHSSAAVYLDILCLEMPAMVCIECYISCTCMYIIVPTPNDTHKHTRTHFKVKSVHACTYVCALVFFCRYQ